MKLKFDSNLEYQREAIDAVVNLFEGVPSRQSEFEISSTSTQGELFNELGIANQLPLAPEQLLKNLYIVQEGNTIPKSRLLVDNPQMTQIKKFLKIISENPRYLRIKQTTASRTFL
jgi:restriction endonuclease